MTRRRTITLIKTVLLFFVLSGCTRLDCGTVIKKRYEKPERHLILMPLQVGKVTVMQQYWIFDEEDWVLTVEGERNGKVVYMDVYVTKQCYNALTYGDTWVKDQYCSFIDNNNSKHKAD